MNLDNYRSRFGTLTFHEAAPRVLEVVISADNPYNSMSAAMHRDLAYVWRDIDLDESVNAVLVRGEGKGFCVGGDFELVDSMLNDERALLSVWKEAKDLVYNMIDCSKPIVSAIHGPAVGAGLAVAMLADISIAAKDARLIDNHTQLGVACGDFAVILWPLLCGMAKAKYYLLTGQQITGEDADRLGLVSLSVAADELQEKALETAKTLAAGSPTALRWTKQALNNWLRAMGPSFDHSLALEMFGFRLGDIREGLAAVKNKRQAEFTLDNPV